MKPYVLRGHSRPITQVLYNSAGDLLFSTSKDTVTSVWWSSNGERLGTLGTNTQEGFTKVKNQHRNAVWAIDVIKDSTQAFTSSADRTVKLWDVSNGTVLSSYEFEASIRSVSCSMDSNLFCCTQDKQMTAFSTLFVVDKREKTPFTTPDQQPILAKCVASWKLSQLMLMDTKCVFGWMDKTVLTVNEKGIFQKWDWRNTHVNSEGVGQPLAEIQAHGITGPNQNKNIKDLKLNADKTIALTSGKDKYARLWDIMQDTDIEMLKEIEHPSNANCCSFNPVKPHIAVAGGQDARDVTGTGGSGNFETYLYNMISEQTIGNFKGHFGPVNTLSFSPDGSQIATGGEEALIRINNLDSSYLNYRDLDMDILSENQNYISVM